MKYLKLFILLLPFQFINAQQENAFSIGAAVSANLLFEQYNFNSHYEILPPPDIYIHAGYKFNSGFNVVLSAGYILLADNWNGTDLGIAIKSQAGERFYTIFGINYTSASGGEGEGNQATVYYKKNFFSGNFGAGYLVTKNAFVELNYILPLSSDKVYGFNHSADEILKLNGRLKISFGWNFYL